MMLKIHEYLFTVDPSLQLREIGTQDYEADVVLLEDSGKDDHNPSSISPQVYKTTLKLYFVAVRLLSKTTDHVP